MYNPANEQVIMMIQTAYDFFTEYFLSTGITGYLGPMALVIFCFVLATKDKFLGVIGFVVECLFLANYFTLVEATPDYWWQIIILLLGVIMTCVPLSNR